MPMLPPRKCHGCGQLVTGACPTCRRTYDRHRTINDAEHRQAYRTHRWTVTARHWLDSYPLCGMRADGQQHAEHSRCVQRGDLYTLAEHVDHIIPTSKGGDHWDTDNLQSLCASCNWRKSDRVNRRAM